MAWTRPKHPKRKEPVDPVESMTPLLSFFSGRRYASQPNPKPRQTSSPVPRDPILRDLQQAQAMQHEEKPATSHSHTASNHPPTSQQQHYAEPEYDQEDHFERSTRRTVSQYVREPSPPPPPPRLPVVRPKPRVASYERRKPEPVIADRHIPRHMPALHYVNAVPSRATSSRWASATTPLNL